jgi:peptidoglycan/xylan/chitin deacetylase (PgdA/CDA1 family)
MTKLYITIDDTPTAHSKELGDLLVSMKVPALFFLRGARMEEYFDNVVDLIARGFVMANHLYSHQRSSLLSFDEIINEIERTEILIDRAYEIAGVTRHAKYIRFPHMDRGTGGWVVDYNAAPIQHQDTLKTIMADGLNVDLTPPSIENIEKKEKLQQWLRDNDFVAPPFYGVNHDWYNETEMAHAVDAMFTYSTSDWMLTNRHLGKWRYKSIEDLKQKIDDDIYLSKEDSAHIILLHDDPDNIIAVTKALLLHFKDKNYEFLSFNR